GLAGCAGTDIFARDTLPGGYQANHPILVAEAPVNLDIAVGYGSAGLSSGDRARIAAFAAEARQHATTQVLVLRPANSANASIAATLAAQARDAVIAGGVPAHLVGIATYSVADPAIAAPIRLTFNRLQAVTQPCGVFTSNVYAGAG